MSNTSDVFANISGPDVAISNFWVNTLGSSQLFLFLLFCVKRRLGLIPYPLTLDSWYERGSREDPKQQTEYDHCKILRLVVKEQEEDKLEEQELEKAKKGLEEQAKMGS